MALVVETGAGVTGANTYVALQAFLDFAEANGYALPEDDDLSEGFLLRSCRAMDRMRWKGEKVAETQPLKWPRTSVYNEEGELLSATTIPAEIVNGQMMLALEMYAEDVLKDEPGGGAAMTQYSAKVGDVEESKTFDLARRNTGKLMRPSASDSSRAQFADLLLYRGLQVVRA